MATSLAKEAFEANATDSAVNAHHLYGRDTLRHRWFEGGLTDQGEFYRTFHFHVIRPLGRGNRDLLFPMKGRLVLRFLVGILSAVALSLGAPPQTAIYEQYIHQATQYQKEGRYAQAEAAYTAALEDIELKLGPEHVAAAQVLVNIGTVRALQHDDSGAKKAFDRSLALTERAFGAEHLQVGLTLLTIAMLTHKQGHYATAEPLYRRALTILEKNLGPVHERTALLKASMAKLYLVQGRNSDAEALLEEAIPVLENAGEPDEATLMVALAALGDAYLRDGRYSKAEPLYNRVLARSREKPQAMNDEIQLGLRAYARMLRKMKRKTEAREIEEQLKTMFPR
jgi:tetratricopeptide (TPR) repeat protein